MAGGGVDGWSGGVGVGGDGWRAMMENRESPRLRNATRSLPLQEPTPLFLTFLFNQYYFNINLV